MHEIPRLTDGARLNTEAIGPLGDAAFAEFRALLLRVAGIGLGPGKKAMVAGRLAKRMRQLELTSYAEYQRLVVRHPEEQQTVLDLLTTNETHFFRERPHFDFIRDRFLPGCVHPPKVWSAAASTGQEAYSVAMLLARHAQRDGWEVFGSDISARVIKQAQRGQYAIRQAEELPRDYLKEYCRRGVGSQAGTFIISPEIRARVRFAQINLNAQLPDVGLFDLVLLRNVLIYFPIDVKRQVVARLLERLRPGGVFIVGHSESLGDIAQRLTPLAPSVYRKP